MEKRITRNFGHITFIVYLCLVALIPITHGHAADALSDNIPCDTGHGMEHLPFSSAIQCCEIHENNHANSVNHHIHFLLDDQGRATRHNQTDTSLAPQFHAAIGEIHLKHFLSRGIGFVFSTADFYQDVLRSYSSGLSPPIV
ncbi:MAG: hypothetical protein HZB62_11805 [Nitrospirae bacterium]|nr:hypothetical protein [Nitrospirota bacterium]